MIQPGPDEISQGMDRRPSPVTEKLISFGDAQRTRLRRRVSRLRGPRALIATGSAAVLVIGAIITAVVVSRPSYPHAWCRSLLTELHVQGESYLGYTAALAGLQRRDHAPVGKLLSDLYDYTLANSIVQNQNDLTPSGSVAGMTSTFTAVRGDLRALNRRCGQRPRAYEGDSF